MDIETKQNTTVWDPLVRVLHWILVAAFVIAFATEDDLMTLHVWSGYLIAAVIAVRLLWGIIGTQHARFTDFVTSPRGRRPGGQPDLRRLCRRVETQRAQGGAEEHAGPMASLFVNSGDRWEDALEELHEFFANFSLLLVVIHVAGVLLESLIHKENLVRSMINGLKRVN